MPNNLPSLPNPSSPPPDDSVQLATRESSHPHAFEELPQGGEQGVNWGRYLAAIKRYKWLALLLAIAGTAAGFGVSQTIEPQYSAQSTVWIESNQEGVQGPIRPRELLPSPAWVELLRSYAVLGHAVTEQRLYLRAETPRDSAVLASLSLGEGLRAGGYRLVVDDAGGAYTLMSSDGTVVETGKPGDPVGKSVGLDWTPPASALTAGRSIEFTVSTPGDAVRRLMEQLVVQADKNATFIRIAMTGTDPEHTAAVVNAVTNRFIDVAAELKRAQLKELTEILNEQLQYAERNLRGAEAALEGFRVQTATLPSDRAAPVPGGLGFTTDPAYSSFFDLRIEQGQIQRDREAIQSILGDASRNELAIGALEVIPSVQSSSELKQLLTELASKRAELRALQTRYTDENRLVQQKMEEVRTLEQQQIPTMVASLQNQLAAREREIASRIASASSELREIPTRAIEEQGLQRRMASAENLYTTLRDKYEVTRLAAASSIPDVRVLDSAVAPQRPANADGKMQIVLFGLLAGLGLGIAGSVLLDRMDPRFRYPEQVTQEMGLNILGAVPHVADRKGRLGGENTAQVVEAFREVRLNVAHAYGAAGPVVLTITSPGIGDGKSFVASNLALAFADQGYRTLLIDGDIRRGGLHRLFERERKPGLTDYLAGRVSREQVIQKTAYPSLHLLPCGTRMKGGPELLGTPPMPRLLAELRSLYSVILIDSPPLGAGVDPFALGTMSGNLMLVLRTGNTNRELAEAKLHLLDRLPVRILGAVLNDVPGKGIYRYYSYLSGYEARDEALTEAAEAKQLQGV